MTRIYDAAITRLTYLLQHGYVRGQGLGLAFADLFNYLAEQLVICHLCIRPSTCLLFPSRFQAAT